MRLKIQILAVALLAVLALGLLLTSTTRSGSQEGAVNVTDVGEHLMQLDRDFDEATAARGVDGWVEYFANDGKMFPAGANVVQGKGPIRELMAPSFENPDFSLRWHPVAVRVSQDGTLGFTHGEYVVSYLDGEGNPVKGYGKYVTIWAKQADGTWKIVADIGTTSPAPEE